MLNAQRLLWVVNSAEVFNKHHQQRHPQNHKIRNCLAYYCHIYSCCQNHSYCIFTLLKSSPTYLLSLYSIVNFVHNFSIVFAMMFDIFTIINIVSKVLDDSPSSYNAVAECKKLEPWCSCGISDDENIYKLSCNQIKDPTKMPNFTYLDLRHLSSLDFSGSYFGKTLHNAKPFSSMRITSRDVQFDLQQCSINSISESFTEILGSSVTIWKLSDNYLSKLPSLYRLKSLQNIDLSNNRFKDVPTNLCTAPALTVVNFAQNSFHQDISEQVAPFSQCAKLHKVYWDSNRKVDCSCESLKHYMWSHENGPPFIEKDSSKLVRCHQKSQLELLRNEPLISLKRDQICSMCNCTEYLVSVSGKQNIPSFLVAIAVPVILCFVFM